MLLLLQSLECWDYRCVSPHLHILQKSNSACCYLAVLYPSKGPIGLPTYSHRSYRSHFPVETIHLPVLGFPHPAAPVTHTPAWLNTHSGVHLIACLSAGGPWIVRSWMFYK